MPTNTPHAWEGPANDLKESKELVAKIKSRLESLVRTNSSDSIGVIYDQIVRLQELETDLSDTRSDINDIGNEQKDRILKLIRDYEDKLEAHENKLKRRNSEIKELRRQLSDLKAGDNKDEPKKPGSPKNDRPPKNNDKKPDPPANSSKPVETEDERFANDLATAGRNAFDDSQFDKAERNFNEARRAIDYIPLEQRRRYNATEVSYYLAACAALSSKRELKDRATKLVDFLHYHGSSQHLDPYQYAHINHLLSQLYIQLGELENAEAVCKRARDYTADLPKDDERRHAPIALAIRINELKKVDPVVNNAWANRLPSDSREWFKQKYTYLRPQGTPKKQPTDPMRPQPPVGLIRAPTWSVPRLQDKPAPPKPQDPLPKPAPRPPRRVIDTETRKRWLRSLELREETSAFQTAIIASNVDEIKLLIRRGRQIPTTALHVAALFGEAEIADLLIKEGRCNVNQTCTIRRLNPNPAENQYHSHGVTPMHIAIGAQQHEMIRHLHDNGASLRKPLAVSKNKPVAPPRYLLLQGWLEMIGCRDPTEVVQTVDLLCSLPTRWNINSSLDSKEKTILDIAMELETTVPGFRSTVVKELQSRGATR